MKLLITLLFFFAIISCNQENTKQAEVTNISAELYNSFDTGKHLRPLFDKINFDTLHSWGFGCQLLESINIAKGDEDEIQLSKRFSPGQKALYFIWYLDAQVVNGGFIQFYWNDYREYLPPIIDGMKLIGDREMLNLVEKADTEYLAHQSEFKLQKLKEDWEPLYENLTNFEKFDSLYDTKHHKTMELIEKYAKQNPAEFVKFK